MAFWPLPSSLVWQVTDDHTITNLFANSPFYWFSSTSACASITGLLSQTKSNLLLYLLDSIALKKSLASFITTTFTITTGTWFDSVTDKHLNKIKWRHVSGSVKRVIWNWCTGSCESQEQWIQSMLIADRLEDQ